MSLKNSKFRKALQGMIQQYWPDTRMHEELMQEALFHFWCERTAHRRGTASWHVESCRYHLLHWLHRGHSIDSCKRRHNQFLASDWAGATDLPRWLEKKLGCDESFDSTVNGNDLFNLVSHHLTGVDSRIFAALAAGLGPSAIGETLGVGSSFVSKRLQHIAGVAIKLGFSPLPRRAGARSRRPSGSTRKIF